MGFYIVFTLQRELTSDLHSRTGQCRWWKMWCYTGGKKTQYNMWIGKDMLWCDIMMCLYSLWYHVQARVSLNKEPHRHAGRGKNFISNSHSDKKQSKQIRRHRNIVTRMWRGLQRPPSRTAEAWEWHRPASGQRVHCQKICGVLIYMCGCSTCFFYLPDESPPYGLVVPGKLGLHLFIAWRQRKGGGMWRMVLN